MALSAGTRLGNFEILGTLGAGGMGVVYRARDTKLRREVALKILPDMFASDPERLDRFQREAQAVAALNHPNVVTIYSVEEVDGLHFLTMELIDGKTLIDLLRPGGLPLDGLLKLALPLADAISAAHQRSIVHRDLKPGNVMLNADGRVKVLDFGLAKLRQESQKSRETSVVTTGPFTAPQSVLGTAAYMSPEQAEGKPVDARSDIFSLGVMLYEMATGTRPFHGDSPLAILSSILRDAPAPLAQLRPGLPPDLDRIVRRCLAKEPGRRFQTALDVRNELEDLERQIANDGVAPEPATAPRGWPRLGLQHAMGVVGLLVVVATSVLVWRQFDNTTGGLPLRATFDQLTSQPGGELFARLSPDGKWIVYSGEGAGNRDIYLQSVSGRTPINLTADSLADDEHPAFSPDGERIAFRSSRDGGGLFVMGRTGEAVRRVTREGFNPAWSPDGTELAYTTVATETKPQNAEQRGQLKVIAVNGGQPRALQDNVVLQNNAMLPSWSPRGLRIAFSGGVVSAAPGSNVVTLTPAGGDPVPVTQDAFLNWNPVWAPDGRHLYFVSNRGGSMNIWRVAIDEASGRTRGEPEPITTPAAFATHLSISSDGRLLSYSAVQETQNVQKLRLDPVKGEVIGEPVPVTTGSRFWANPDPSPDGASVVFYSQVGPEGDLYVARSDGTGGLRQLTDDVALDRVPRWSPDGEWIAMFSNRSGRQHVWKIRTDGSDLQQVTQALTSVVAWSPDGRRLAATRSRPEPGEPSASILDAHGSSELVDLAVLPPPNSQFPFAANSWSPDGRRIAGQYGFTTLGIVVYSLEARTFEHMLGFGEWPVWLPDSQRILLVSRGREFHVLDTRTRTTNLIFSVVRDTLGPPRLTRDGREAYFSRRITEADVWIATLR